MNRQKNHSVHSPSPCEDEWNWVFLCVFPTGVWQSSIAAGAANVWRDRQRAVRGERRRGWHPPGAAGGVSAVGHSLPSSSVRFPIFHQPFWLFSKSCRVFAVRVLSGLWGLRWCVPVMRASSGLLGLARAACRATRQRPEAAERGAPRGIRAVESESQCALVCSSVSECLTLFLRLWNCCFLKENGCTSILDQLWKNVWILFLGQQLLLLEVNL